MFVEDDTIGKQNAIGFYGFYFESMKPLTVSPIG